MKETAEASRFQTALVMAETGVRLMRQNFRRHDAHASDAEIDAKLHQWLISRPMDTDDGSRRVSSR